MQIKTEGNGKKSLIITTNTPFELAFVRAMMETIDPLSITFYLRDRGFIVKDGDVETLIKQLEEAFKEE